MSPANRRICELTSIGGEVQVLKGFSLSEASKQRHFASPEVLLILDASQQRHLTSQCFLLESLLAQCKREANSQGKCQQDFRTQPHAILWRRSLACWIRKNSREVSESAVAVRRRSPRDVISGLQAEHAASSVHCGIKPANVFLTTSMRAATE
eukprot:CAMPEP_0202084062 /NCGR_PEP_ID=MMETSP0964-20121228/26309_1 /ASSEMBLY_ACC=CAM_ASM_000500 /TAXON_ID=4773 /ORGANISM="Schizochytrium aggregatum, Strain ATCC28209" /LENGTH=152 /DNA_ID=CAMNT_0048651815 /DNA_START=93 /DNA_END=552 /DNA_ORIENTATION=+